MVQTGLFSGLPNSLGLSNNFSKCLNLGAQTCSEALCCRKTASDLPYTFAMIQFEVQHCLNSV